MELKVWFDGMPRVVGNVVGTTTAEEVVRALTESLKLPDTYSLLAYWNGNEINLSPSEKPLSFINRIADSYLNRVRRRRGCALAVNSIESSNIFTTEYSFVVDAISKILVFVRITDQQPPRDHSHLQDQLTKQEQDLDLNRIKLSQLDNEVARLEAISALTGGNKSVGKVDGGRLSNEDDLRDDFKDAPIGPAFELAQLAAVDWNSQMEEQNTRHRNLRAELAEYQSRLQNLDQTLSTTRSNLTCLESELAQELTRLLESLDSAITQRRDFLASAAVACGANSAQTSAITTTVAPSSPTYTSSSLTLHDGLMI
ncbi:unnamed protein product [Dibothriocephalus latus]|uniref:Ras-associating domain-containing protein n=1 Tax=Dibothriocephalus latus TaxID=60516 RepID=A0A3P7LRT6_DIBLA|nr:unnamed protein product [Dibothriocephalus latus]